MFWTVVIGISCVKGLMLPAYFSTDFDVHRNWLATTYSLPLKEWYEASHSEWTLDYPPFFAWFEFLLAQIGFYFDPDMLDIKKLNYRSENTILFQRMSVIVTDLVYAYGINECGKYMSSSNLRKNSQWKSRWNSPSSILMLLLLTNGSLFMLDHIHFQYNAFLYGMFLISIIRMLQGKKLESAIWYGILLNFKHIFLYVCPAYAVYLLRNYCFSGPVMSKRTIIMKNCRKLAISLGVIFFISFGPFIWYGQFFQVWSRLFPFKRGLCHAYWAPNFWALYNTADKITIILGRKLGFNVTVKKATMTGGLVEQIEHTVLPSITPLYTFILTLLAMLPCLRKMWVDSHNPLHFVRCIVLCACSSFAFGWHVHEKAILLPIIPFTIMTVIWKQEASIYLLLSSIGTFCIFPLLYKPFEFPLKLLIFLLHSTYAFCNFAQLYNFRKSYFSLPLLNFTETFYLLLFIPLFLFDCIFKYFYMLDYPFLSTMLISIHNAIGFMYCYLKYYFYFMGLKDVNYKRRSY